MSHFLAQENYISPSDCGLFNRISGALSQLCTIYLCTDTKIPHFSGLIWAQRVHLAVMLKTFSARLIGDS